MIRDQYDQSLATGEVQLNGFWEKSNHYGAAWFLFFASAVALVANVYLDLQGGQPFFIQGQLLAIAVPFCLGFLALWIQKKRLMFKVVQTTLKRAQIKPIIEQVAVDLKWNGSFTSENVYEATTSPGFFSGSWGEQITVLLAGNQVLINSICDLKRRSSMVSMGRNRQNEETLAERINESGKLGVNNDNLH